MSHLRKSIATQTRRSQRQDETPATGLFNLKRLIQSHVIPGSGVGNPWKLKIEWPSCRLFAHAIGIAHHTLSSMSLWRPLLDSSVAHQMIQIRASWVFVLRCFVPLPFVPVWMMGLTGVNWLPPSRRHWHIHPFQISLPRPSFLRRRFCFCFYSLSLSLSLFPALVLPLLFLPFSPNLFHSLRATLSIIHSFPFSFFLPSLRDRYSRSHSFDVYMSFITIEPSHSFPLFSDQHFSQFHNKNSQTNNFSALED